MWEENRSKIVWWRSWGAPRGIFGRFSCRPSYAHVSGSLRGPFWEPFWPQKCSFFDLVFWSRGSFFCALFSTDIYYASPLKVDCFGRCQNKAHMACDPQKPINFQLFAYARRRQPRSKEDNRGQIIAQKKRPQICQKTTNKSSFLRSRLGRPKKVQK